MSVQLTSVLFGSVNDDVSSPHLGLGDPIR
jgi:hypothetical protein